MRRYIIRHFYVNIGDAEVLIGYRVALHGSRTLYRVGSNISPQSANRIKHAHISVGVLCVDMRIHQ